MKQNTLNFKAQLGVVTRYRLEVCKVESGRLVRSSGWCENLIPTRGLDLALRGGTHGNPRLTCIVGTGTTPPAMNNTGLQNLFAASDSVQELTRTWQTSAAPYWLKVSTRMRFNAGVFNGTNITEVGTREYYGSQWLYSRALVVDANGNPAAVTILSDEYLDVVQEHYVVMGQYTGTFNQLIDGVSTPFNYTIRPIEMASANWGSSGNPEFPVVTPQANASVDYSVLYRDAALSGPATSAMDGTQIGRFETTTGSPAYVDGSLLRRIRFNAGLNQANHANGITGFKINCTNVKWQCLISPAVLKIATKVYYIEFDVTLANAAIPE